LTKIKHIFYVLKPIKIKKYRNQILFRKEIKNFLKEKYIIFAKSLKSILLWN